MNQVIVVALAAFLPRRTDQRPADSLIFGKIWSIRHAPFGAAAPAENFWRHVRLYLLSPSFSSVYPIADEVLSPR